MGVGDQWGDIHEHQAPKAHLGDLRSQHFHRGVSLVALAFLLISPKAPPELRPDIATAAAGGSLATFLIVSSVLLFFRIRRSRWLTFAAAILFYGTLVLQQVALLGQIGDTLTEQQRLKVLASSSRSIIEIVLNAWALFSAKTSRYFGASGVDPQQVVPADGPRPAGSPRG